MATAGAAPPDPRTCYSRMCRAVVHLGGDMMRDALCHKINPSTIVSCSTRVVKLSRQQRAVVFNAQSKGDYSECDVSLLYTLLRNCTATNTALTPTNGWGNTPSSSDVTLGDDLERIRFMRNKVYGHIATTSIPHNIYTKYMNRLQDICQRMDTVHKGLLTRLSRNARTYSQMLNDIQICCMDPDMEAKYIDEIRRLCEEGQKRERDIQRVTERLNEHDGDIQSVTERLNEHDGDIQSVTERLNEQERDIQSVTEHLNDLSTQSAEQRQTTANLENKVQEQGTQLGQRVDTIRSDMQQQATEQRQAAATLENKVYQQGAQLDEQREATVNLKSTIQQQADEQREATVNLTSRIQQQADEQREATVALRSTIQQQAETIAETRQMIKKTEPSSQQNNTEEDKRIARETLLEKYENVTQCVTAIPLGDTSMPLDQLYSPAFVAEDTKSQSKRRKEDKQTDRKPITMSGMFLIDGKPAKRIFMKGEAGRGKTVFTIKLVDDWCKIQQRKQSDKQEVLSQFDLTFYVSMRYVEKKRNKVVDMICDCLSEGDPKVVTLFRRVLCNKHIRCLVILDGLDEWSNSPNTFPNTYGLVNCVLFTSTRPWKLEKLRMPYTPQDKVVEILGIDPDTVEALIRRIVTHLYKTDNQNLENKLTTCIERAGHPMVKSLLTLPMILTAACHVWCEEDKDITHGKSEHVSNSMTYFILSIEDLLIKRGEQKNEEVEDYLLKQRKEQDRITRAKQERCIDQTQQSTSGSSDMMTLLSRFFPYINHFIDILTPFFKLAYNDLLSSDPRLVFEKYQLEGEIGMERVDLALKVGIISQCRAPGCFNIQNVSVSFPHKLIQELMAAMFIVCQPDMLQEFCHHCNSIDKIMELGNVVRFVSGLDRTLGGKLWQHVVCIAQTDDRLILWRQTMGREHWDRVRSLYLTQCEWYREMEHVSAMMGSTHLPPYHVSDVYLMYSDSEVKRVTGELMSTSHHTIMSVCLRYVSHIPDIIGYLPQHSGSLTALYIRQCDVQDMELLVTVLPQLTQLHSIQYGGTHSDVDADVVAALTRLTRLKYVELWYITLYNTPLCVSHMTQLETLVLVWVRMTAGGWGVFLSSLLSIPHKVKVTLHYTDIDADSITMIKSSPQFTFIKHYTDILGDTIEFYRET